MSETETISNVTLVLASLYGLGGAERYVDIEEVTLSAFNLSPDRFGWRTRRELPSWERVRTAFVHANQQEKRRGHAPLVVSNTGGTAWRLTAEGVSFVHANSHQVGAPRQLKRRSGKSAERVRQIRSHPTFLAFSHGTPAADIKRFQLADLLLCPPDSPIDSARRRLDSARAAAMEQGDAGVTNFLSAIGSVLTAKWA
jgi:hypothetical protein